MTTKYPIHLATANPLASLDELLQSAHNAGITNIRLSHEQAIDDAKGARIMGVDVPPLTAENRDEFERQMSNINERMTEAKRNGITAVSMESGRPNAAVTQFLKTGLLRLNKLADESGIVVHLRNRYRTRLEQPLDFHQLLSEINSASLRVEIDTAQFHRSCVNPCEPIAGLQHQIGCVRMTNIRAHQPTSLANGEIDMTAVANALTTIKYKGPLVLLLPDNNTADVESLTTDRRFLETALQRHP